jgi:hypothetical protein
MKTWADLVGEKPDQIEITTETGEKYIGIDAEIKRAFGNPWNVARVSCESWHGLIYPSYDRTTLYLLTEHVHEGDENLEGTIEKIEVSW